MPDVFGAIRADTFLGRGEPARVESRPFRSGIEEQRVSTALWSAYTRRHDAKIGDGSILSSVHTEDGKQRGITKDIVKRADWACMHFTMPLHDEPEATGAFRRHTSAGAYVHKNGWLHFATRSRMIDSTGPLMPTKPILLVDDDPFLGPVASELLGALGRPTVWATDLRRASELLDGPQVFTAILLDLQVGSERGETLVDDRRATPLPPIIIFSAQPLEEMLLAAEHVHAAAILQKPCSAQDIVAALEATCSD